LSRRRPIEEFLSSEPKTRFALVGDETVIGSVSRVKGTLLSSVNVWSKALPRETSTDG
jgi:hypothetical protein